MEQLIGSRLRKEYDTAVCCCPVCLIYTLSTLRDMLGWMTYNWNEDKREKHQQPQIVDDTTIMAEDKEKLKSLLMKVKEESERADLKLNIKKTKIMTSGLITSWQIEGGRWK